MKEPALEPLKRMAESIAEASSQEKIASLSRAFELFSHETERIENAYNSLKEEFTAIHQELEETNTNLKKKVAELDALAYYMKNILSNISQGLLFIDLNGDVTTYNAAAKKLFKIPEEDVLFRNYWKNFEDNAFGFSMRKALAAKSSPPLSYTTLKNLEGKKDLEVTSNFVIEEEKRGLGHDLTVRRMEGVIVLVRDITEIRALEFIAKRTDRMKELGEMAASVAHEIRNPLGGIKGFASLLMRDLENNPESKRFAEYIIQGADTLNRLVTSILDYSKPIDLKRQQIHIQHTIKEVVETAKADPSLSKGIDYAFDMPEEEITIPADHDHLKNAFLNLIVNAVQAMPNGGTLDIIISSEEDFLTIEFKDTGVGIPKDHLARLFAPFFTTKAEGHGFGLPEVLKTVQAHGGDIKVESELGAGSSFFVKLPTKLHNMDG